MEKMSRGQIQDLVGKFATENPKYRAAIRIGQSEVLP